MQTAPTLSELTEFAVHLARRAGELTLEYFRHGVEADVKADGTPVTEADRRAEELLRREIGERFPEDGLVGEEFGAAEGGSGRTWILDPIDGTRSFVHGVPLYGVLIGLEIGGEAALGVIHLPALGETVWAYAGGGCWWNGTRVDVSRVSELGRSLVTTSEVPVDGRLDALFAAAGVRRTWGDCYGYALVATGRAEVMIDPAMKLWDAAPLQTVIEEAGGHFTDWQGRPTVHSGDAVATNGLVAGEVLAITKGR